MTDVDLRQLRTFVAVAECGSFTDAAALLEVSQPSVSRGIAALERALDVRLLDRNTRECVPTVEGARFLAEVRVALDAVDRAVASVAPSRVRRRALRFALKADSDAGLLPEVLARFAADGADRPAVELVFAETSELADLVRRGAADVALVVGPDHGDTRLFHGVEVEPVWRESRVAVLPAGHELAARGVLARADLDDEPVLAWPDLPPSYDRYYRGADRLPPERAPRPGPAARNLAEALRLVELGRGVTFLPLSVAERSRRPTVAVVPVDDLSASVAYVAWREGSRDRAIAALLEATLAAASARRAEAPAAVVRSVYRPGSTSR
ncbi:LysR family transcriptional regulator [Luteimicrobium sp. NPDC057192]|uniref:LysR family transcriptional regulator n=1 Tax=Luteimicrobium sp. NPDC057192 TaxID=3346042 RepID=UPI003624EBD1